MAASLGSLVVSLGLDAAEFTRGLTKSEYEAQRALKNIKKEAEEMGRAMGLAAAAAGSAAVVMGAKFIEAAANLDDMAEKTGASVEELSKLSQQAYISGTALEGVETGLIRLTKALHGGDEEAKGAGKALAALGLKADELKNKDTAVALRIVADELNKYQDGAGKTALALDLFGKSGAQLLPFLKDMANDAALNVRVTAEQAAKAEELGKAWRRLINDAQGIGQAMALDIMPKLIQLIEQFREGTRIAGGFWAALLKFGTMNPFRTSGESVANLSKSLASFRETRAELVGRRVDTAAIDKEIASMEKQLEFAKFMQRQEALGLGGTDTPGEMQRFGLAGAKKPLDYQSNAVKEAKDFTKQIEDLKRLYEEVKQIGQSIDVAVFPPTFKPENLEREKRELGDLKKTLEGSRKDWIALADAVFNEADAANTAAGAGESFTQTAEKTRDKLLDLIDPLRAVKREHEQIDLLVATGWMTQMDASLAKLPSDVRALLQPLTNIHNEIQKAWEAGLLTDEQHEQALSRVREHHAQASDDITEFWRRAAEGSQQAFSELFFNVMQGELDNFGKNALRMLDRIVAEILAAKAATALFGSDFGKGGSGQIGGLIGMGIDWFTRALGGGATPWSDNAAAAVVSDGAGGFVPALDGGTPFVEREGLAYLHRGERVLTARENQQFGDAAAPVVSISVHARDVDSFRRTMPQLAAQARAAFAA